LYRLSYFFTRNIHPFVFVAQFKRTRI